MSKAKTEKTGIAKIDFSQFADCVTPSEVREKGNHASGLVPDKKTHCAKNDFAAIGKEYLFARGQAYAACLASHNVKGYASYSEPSIASSIHGEKAIGLALCVGTFTPSQTQLSSKDLNACETGILPLLKKVAGIASCYTRSIKQRMTDMTDKTKFRMSFADVTIKNEEHRKALISVGYTGLITAKTGDVRTILNGINPLVPVPSTDTEKGKKAPKKTDKKTAPKSRKTAPKKPVTVIPETAPNASASV